MDDPIGASATALADAIRAGELSAETVLDAHLDRIADHEELNAFVTVIEDSAREQARRADEAAEAGESLGPLHGVPVAIKDLMQRKAGVRNTLGLAPLSDHVAETDSVTVERLEAAGAVILGTTNTPALGHTIKTDNRLQGSTPTPFDDGHSAGGSSGGSAAALAAGLTTIATGSDIGGSLRVPASCCHVASIKPTFGRVPSDSEGLDRFNDHSPFLVLGPLARSVEDVALAYDLLAGPDDRDPFSVPETPPVSDRIDRPAAQFSVAYSPDLDLQPVAPEVRETVGGAVDDLASAGATVDERDPDLPSYAELSEAYMAQVGLSFAAIATQIEERFGIDFETADVVDTVPSTIALGKSADALETQLQNVPRTAAYDAIEAVLDEYDVLVTPTLTVPPYSRDLADGYPTEIDGEEVMGVPTDQMLTWVFNMTGHPVAAVPAGRTDDGLPVGLQIVGRRYAEADVLAVATAIEEARPWAAEYPFAES
ncbi:amidase [Halovenus sp. WSH3]|uniref:Amidase n=1 Tax=Halovenus carboxidivorans TaxID=2692199 RepID=A0A6B0T1H1_9EURY|nr:amidase [Halovenus carboxidivorans]MXR50076.1 amidase [Halovenus carboxidivorans]